MTPATLPDLCRQAGASSRRHAAGFVTALVAAAAALWAPAAQAQETVCARVKIEIKQELTLERQAFDAEMKINNTTDTESIDNVSVVIRVTDESGTPVAVSDNPNDTSAKFFVRLSSKQNISAVDGTGSVSPKTTSTIDWLLIPAPGSAGNSPLGKKYLVGATLKYKFGGEETVLDVAPDVITVKPLPLLTLDYFLTQDVIADDPLTAAIEATEPFTLGVRVKNNGFAAAKNLKIDSAQPKIVENNQGLLINFQLTGSYVNDAPVQNTLLINFGDVAAGTSTMGRWTMETTLAGKFTEFTARFSHADELGGALTSLLQATNAHFLIRDVRVDLSGRDAVRDFLAQDGDVVRVYESDGPDTVVIDRSAVAALTANGTGPNGNANYRLSFPPTDGFAYVKLPDPYSGTKALGQIKRSDAKQLLTENVWLSKTRNLEAKRWEYWVNVFDVNTTGVYDSEFQAPPATARPPVVQFIPDRVTKEAKPVSFLVEASSPDGKAVSISAAPLPAGATLTPQAADPAAPGLTRAVFNWNPPKGAAGSYLISYTATDGTLSAARSASIKVEVDSPPPGPGTPTLEAPLAGAQVTSLKPTLSVQTSTNPQDPTTQVQFEVYADEALTQPVANALVAKAAPAAGNGAGAVAAPTTWSVPDNLNDNTGYWWRARGFDGALYSAWANGRFFVNLFNDPPDTFNLTTPAPNAEVASLTPTLAWTNSADKDGDVITYSVAVYKDAALTTLIAQVANLSEDPSGSTGWLVNLPLANHVKYYWRVVAKDALGAETSTAARPFLVNTGNTAPSSPVLLSPAVGGQSLTPTPSLVVQNSTDADADLLTCVFEIDTVNTFDSGNKRSSGQVIQNGTGNTAWVVPAALVENTRYWWRVKAQDGRTDSAWVVGDFLMNAINEAPPTPTVKNPGDGSWVATRQPTLEANPVVDPEGDAVLYQFEVYLDAALTRKVTEGSSANTGLIVPVQLADKTTHWWRVRAIDPQNLASAWGPATLLYVSTAPYQNPTIALTSPATPIVPDTVTTPSGTRKQATLRWEGTDPNIEPTVALYYGTSKTGFTGNLIVDGLRQTAGTQTGTYTWDVTALTPGAYYVHAVIYDAKGVGKAYAPGAVVVPSPTQLGSIKVSKTTLATSESGTKGTFTVKLGRAPTADVTLGVASANTREGVVSPAALTFTAANWVTAQTVTVTGVDDCAVDGSKSYQVVLGKAGSLDPNYAGLVGTPVTVTNADRGDKVNTTNNAAISVCKYTVVSQRQVDAKTWEYVFNAEVTNTGAALRSLDARLSGMPSTITVVDAQMLLGAIGSGETIKSVDTFTIRSKSSIANPTTYMSTYAKWSVVTQTAP